VAQRRDGVDVARLCPAVIVSSCTLVSVRGPRRVRLPGYAVAALAASDIRDFVPCRGEEKAGRSSPEPAGIDRARAMWHKKAIELMRVGRPKN
jgi:hypothetical protein